MKELLKGAIIFAAGVGIGSIVTYKIMNKKLLDELKTQSEELASREPVRRENSEETKALIEANINKPPVMEYYQMHAKKYAPVIEEEKEETYVPTVIGFEEFGKEEDYEEITLSYFEDGILADEMGEIFTNADDILGPDALYDFHKEVLTEEDVENVIYIVNHERKEYFEIVREPGEYADTYTVNSHRDDD